MRRLIFILLLCGSAQTQTVQPYIQENHNPGAQTCAYAQNVVSGNILVVGANTEGTLTGISDTRSSSWTLVDSSTASSITTRVWVASAASSGADTVTVTGTSSFNQISCSEFDSSVVTATSDVHTNGSYSGSPASVTTTALTTTVNGDLIYAYISGFSNTGSLFPTDPLKILSSEKGADMEAGGWYVAGAAGSNNAVFFNTGNTQGNYVIIALKPAASITIVPSALPTASTSGSYSYQMYAVQGAGAYTWSISSGSLPSGLSISSGGLISGTPTGGTATFTVQVTDGTNTTTKSETLTVNSAAATPAFVQGQLGSSTLTSVSIGDAIIALTEVGGSNTNKIIRPTDSLGTIFKCIGGITYGGNGGTSAIFWGGVATSSGADTVTLGTLTVSGVLQISNAQNFFDVKSFNTGSAAASATITSNSVTTPVPNSMAYAAAFTANASATLAAVGPFTAAGSTSGTAFPVLQEYDLVSSAGSISASFTQGSNTDGHFGIGIFAVRPSTSGVVSTNHRRAWVIER